MINNTAFHPWKMTVPTARKKALFIGFPIGCCDHNTLCLTLMRSYSSSMERKRPRKSSHADKKPKKMSTNYGIKVICTCQQVD
jgi:hypothetical protein